MTRQTSGMPELKYSEETFRDMYEALKGLLIGLHSSRRRIGAKLEESMIEGRKALAKAERVNNEPV